MLIVAVAAGAMAGPTGSFRVQGFYADLLAEGGQTHVLPPPLRINLEEEMAKAIRKLTETPPPTPLEVEAARQHYERAIQHVQRGEHRRALLELRDGLTYAPDDPRMLAMAAALSVQTREFANAATFFRRYMELEPANLQYAAAYIALLFRMARTAEAEALLSRYEVTAPAFMPFRFHRACFEILADRRLEDDGYWRRRSADEIITAIQWLHGDRDELARAMGAAGYLSLAEHILGPAATSLGELRAAADRLVEARDRRDWPAVVHNGRAMLDMGLRVLGVWALLAEAAEQSGERSEALALWRRIVSDFPDVAQAWASAGQVFLRNRSFEEALRMIRRAKELAPREAAIDFLLASALALTDRIGEAQSIYNHLAARRPRDMRQWMESDPVFEAALDRMPNRTAILRRMEIPPELE